MVKQKNRLTTDALREVRSTLNRYVSILVLAALAVAFLSGLRTAAPDMQYTADNFFDRTNLMDGYVLSTLGLTEEDLDALAGAAGIQSVEGCRDLDATAIDRIVNVRSMPEKLNLLEVKEGRLPEAAGECVTESLLLVKLGLRVGDTLTLTLTEDQEEDLKNTTYTIVGVVNSPLYVGLDRGASSLGNGSVDAFVYVPGENFTFDYYTCAYFTGEGLAELDSYGGEYEDRVDALVDSLDGLADERAQARYDSLIGDAQAELDDARKEFEDAKADAEQELADARQELDDARKELDDGWADYYDGQKTYEREIADAEKKLADALADLRQGEQDLIDGRQEYEDGLAEYEDGLKKYEDGWAEYEDGLAKYEDGLAEYEDGRAQYEDGLAQYEKGVKQYENAVRAMQKGQAQYKQGLEEYNKNKAQLEEQAANAQKEYEAALKGLEGMEEGPVRDAALKSLQDSWTAGQAQMEAAQTALAQGKAQLDAAQKALSGGGSDLSAGKAQLDAAKAELNAVRRELASAKKELSEAQTELADAKAELDDAKAELDDAELELADAKAELEQGEQDLEDGWAEYYQGVEDLRQARADGQRELADALAELNDGEKEYADGEKEYADGKREADEEIADAQKKLDDAQDELDKVEECEWYVLDRFTNAGIVGYSQDSDRVSNLANVFPVIFFLVAALACLTTMTRMVEEQRTQIGSLKAMGFSRLAISKKYIGYAFSASLVGGILGLALGCTLIPLVIANAFNIMYAIPALEFKPQTGMYVGSVLAAVLCTTGAALWACLSTLIDTPANLMRPRAPKAGRRVLLERVGFIWKRLTFTWKVTMRNLFRYQRRFWMTVIGIGGCTALIVTGFGLHESIFSILNEQFDHVFLYDATVGLDKDVGEEKLAAVETYLTDSPWVEDYLPTSETQLEASSGGPAQNVCLFAVDDLDRFNQFIRLGHRLDDEPINLPEHFLSVSSSLPEPGAKPDSGVVITEKLSELLGVSVGDTIVLDGDKRAEVRVADIAENYVSHYVYLSDTCYRELFGEDLEQNVMLLRYADGAGEGESDTVSSDLMAMDGVDSYSYIATLRDNFTDSMEAIDYAVVIIILAAAALAFVVLYNLTNINITERTRELATLKVLGFFDREVTAYVYRENLFLTLFGIALGLVMGRFLHAWMVLTVEVDIVMFGRTAPPYAYWLAAALTVVFSVAVNIAAHFKLKKVDMVESLKTIE